ncbi:conserved hypothetical protein [Methylobacterium nodulans ORS 2060]|uniref:Uncharacterized protein n=1 Tax=Methylobacterium nodulans (strain LMG 21967 / CNCM I-2342 / ORS 2060) TaxID=460265 RepID=B8ILS0_METNO|nr:conserved hypothetical protein [Methylobacterium nodulans ORS 2060]
MRRRRNATDQAATTDRPAVILPAGFEAAAQRLRMHPSFRATLAGYCRGMAEGAPAQWPVYKFFDQMRRYIVCYMLIHNYYAWQHGEGPPPTLSALQRVAGSSARQTAGLVAALKAGHLILAEPDPDDRRIRHLRPAREMIEEIGRSARLFVAAADRLEVPSQNRAALLVTDEHALGDVLRRSAAYVLAHGTLIHPFPRILHFAGRDCGYLLLNAVLCAHYAQNLPGASPPVALSYRTLARRFQVSPAHIGNLLGEAERRGWFATGPSGRLVTMSEDFADEFECWASWQMVHFSGLAAETTAFLAVQTAPRVTEPSG